VLPLQHVKDWSHSLYYERAWIHRLRTHIRKGRILPTNNNKEHQSFTKRKRTHNKNKTNTQHNDTTAKQKQNLHKKVHWLITYNDLHNQPPPSLKHQNTHKLYKILSVLLGTPVYYHARPLDNKLQSFYHDLYLDTVHSHGQVDIDILTRYVQNQINLNIDLLKKGRTARKTASFEVFVVKGYSETIQRLGLNKILAAHQTLLPPNSAKATVKTVYKTASTTGQALLNFHKTASLLDDNYIKTPHTCNCHLPQYNKYVRKGHINTADMDVITEILGNNPDTNKLTSLIKKGPKYAEHYEDSAADIVHKVNCAIKAYITKAITRNSKLRETDFGAWAQAIQADTKRKVSTIHTTTKPFLKQHNIQTLIKKLQSNYTITNTDKFTNNFSIVCKHHWLTELYNNTINPNQTTYRKITKQTADNIIHRHSEYLRPYKFHVYPRLPKKYNTSKQHKDGWRPICAAPAVTTTHLSKVLTIALTAIIDNIKLEADVFHAKTGIRTYFDVDTAKDVRERLAAYNADPEHIPDFMDTADITDWYNATPIEDLIKTTLHIIPKVYNNVRKRYLIIYNNKYKWTDTYCENTYHRHCLTAHEFKRLLIWRLRNQYLEVGNILVKQMEGVGQGDNHSGHLCRLYNIVREINFQLKWYRRNRDVARAFSNTMRKHDDYLFLNNKYLPQYIHTSPGNPGLLPKQLKLNFTNANNKQQAHYLDTTIHILKNNKSNNNNAIINHNFANKGIHELRATAKQYKIKQHGTKAQLIARLTEHLQPQYYLHNKPTLWNLKTYNKKEDLHVNFIPNAYPRYSTSIPKHSITGTITGLLHSYVTTNYIKLQDFIKQVKKTSTHLIQVNGYPKRLIISTTMRFISSNGPFYRTSQHKVAKLVLRALQSISVHP
jgi:hypothetical protein